MKLPLTLLVLVLAGYGFAHIDDTDALFYQHLAENILHDGSPFWLRWTPTQLTDFHDHLPPPVWLVATWLWVGGPVCARLMSAAMVVVTWWLMVRLATRFGYERAATLGLCLVPLSEYYMRVQTVARIDQPFLLAWVAAIALVDVAAPAALCASALATGVALLLRPPLALALFVLVPAVVLARRSLQRADITRLIAWGALAAACPLGLALAAHLAGHDNLWPAYWHAQVLASLSGARTDGDGSHLAVLNGLLHTFWPGLALLVPALFLVARDKLWRDRFVAFLLLWTVAVLGGLSLGKRHLPYHAWIAYPPLLLLCGLFAERVLARVPTKLQQQLAWALVGCAGVFAVTFPLLNRRSQCDTDRVAPLIAALPNSCAVIDVLAASPHWNAANTVVDHLDRDVAFITPQTQLSPAPCAQVVMAPKTVAAPAGARALLLGKRFSFYVLDAAQTQQK